MSWARFRCGTKLLSLLSGTPSTVMFHLAIIIHTKNCAIRGVRNHHRVYLHKLRQLWCHYDTIRCVICCWIKCCMWCIVCIYFYSWVSRITKFIAHNFPSLLGWLSFLATAGVWNIVYTSRKTFLWPSRNGSTIRKGSSFWDFLFLELKFQFLKNIDYKDTHLFLWLFLSTRKYSIGYI